MDQEKVGRFIAACRKGKGLTQAQVAERFGISNRAVSKWETGKSLPDASIMIDLCDLFGITVNELLSGERIDGEDYRKKAEENLVDMQQGKEKNRRTLCAAIVSLIVLVVEYLIVRYSLFGIHRTVQWPLTLWILCLLVVLGSFLSKAIVTPLATSISYMVGFIIGEILKTKGVDAGGGATDNMRIIWTITVLTAAIVSAVMEFKGKVCMKKNGLIRILLLLVSCVPFAFLSVNGDAVSGTMLFYGLMVIGCTILCWGTLKTDNIPILYIGNALSIVSSLLFAKISGLEPMGYYFKPFTSYSLMFVLSILALICQTIPVIVFLIKKKKHVSDKK